MLFLEHTQEDIILFPQPPILLVDFNNVAIAENKELYPCKSNF